jgi:vitamin B12 transporter
MRPCAVLPPLFLSLVCGTSFAQTAPPDVVSLPELVISATGDPTPMSNIGSSVTVITADQIQTQQRRTINEVLETVPGLNLVQTGGPGGQTSVFMRGTNSNHVKVLIDGIDVSDTSTPNDSFDFGQLLTGDIARVEVLRGPQSGFYGSDAIGGVISITTKKGSGPAKATATVEGGSFGTLNEKFGLSGSASIFSYAFSIDHFRSVATPVVPIYLMPPSQKAADQFYDNYTLSSRVGADLTNQLSVNSILRYTDSTLLTNGDGVSGAVNGTPCYCLAYPDRYTQDYYQFFSRQEAVWHSLDSRFQTTLGVNFSDQRRKYNYPADYIANGNNDSTYSGQRLKVDLKQEIGLIPGENLILGGEVQHESLDNVGTGLISPDHTRDSGGVYGELESNPFEHFSVASNIRYDDYQSFGGHATYRIAPAYTVAATGTLLKASVGSGFKAPTLDELYDNYYYGFGSYFYGNPNLKPETSTGWDAGFEQPFFDDRVRVGSTYYENYINNLITTNSSFTSYANISNAETSGVESFASYKVSDIFTLRADYTYTYVRDLTANDPNYAGLHYRRPLNKATLQADWKPLDKLHLSATLLYVSGWLDVDPVTFSPTPAKGYATVNLAANYDINAQTTVFARVNNLFNRQYQNPLGFLQPGPGAYAGVKVSSF